MSIKLSVLTKSLSLFVTFLLAMTASAQPATIEATGVIKDSEGVPVVGATVYLPDQPTVGTFTDSEGRFSLKVPKGAVMLATCTGFEDVRFTAGSNLKITMNLSKTILEEAVVVGYGVQRKESVVGAISQINNETILSSGQANITQAIAGKLSGVTTIQHSGQPGNEDATILVRGVSSWNGNNPLVMVDGVERALNSLDPNEIESISVLKDASATAVFGAKGANGVILVTTRGGQKGKPKLYATVSHTFRMPTMLPEHQDAYTTASAYNVALKNAQNWGLLISDHDLQEYKNPSSEINKLRYPDNNWFDIMLKDVSHSTNANMNVSGGTDRVRYFVSLGYNHDGSIFKLDDAFKEYNDKDKYNYKRLNYRANLDFDLTKSTTLTYRVGGSIGIRTDPGNSLIGPMYTGSTIAFPTYYPAWLMEQIPDWDYPNKTENRLVVASMAPLGGYFGNPHNSANYPSYDETTTTVLFTDLLLKQRLDQYIRGLSLEGKFSFSTTMSRVSESTSRTLTRYYLDWDLYDAGEVNPWTTNTSSLTVVEVPPVQVLQGSVSSHSYSLYWEGSINYDRSWNNHHVTALALFNQRENRSTFEFPYRSMGLVGRVTYDFAHKYLFEANVGYTGSEQFAPANRFGLFPSLAVGYVVSNENWWKNAMPWWSKLKLRYSDGFVGSDQAASRWLYYSSFSKSDHIYQDAAANEVAQWEMAHKRDIGIEMGWLRNRLTSELDLFDEHRTHILVDPVVPYLVGVDYKQVNKGEVKKHGFEFELKWEDKIAGTVGYYVKTMVSFNENRIVKHEDPPYMPDYQKQEGKPYLGQQNGVSVVDGGYYTSVDDIHNYPTYAADWNSVPVGGYKYLDYRPDGVINVNDLHSVEGSQWPSTLGSLGFGFDWKGWEFSALFYGNYGKYVNYNRAWEMDFVKGDTRLSETMADYWRPDHQNVNHSTLVYSGSAGHPMYAWAGMNAGQDAVMGLVGRTWRRADYLNFRDLYLGYTFDRRMIKSRTGIDSLTLYLNGNNLFYITDLVSGNPELTEFKAGTYPLMRTFQFGLKVGF